MPTIWFNYTVVNANEFKANPNVTAAVLNSLYSTVTVLVNALLYSIQENCLNVGHIKSHTTK